MGVLWTVVDTHTGRPYAIKTIRSESEALATRFRREASTWIALGRHENVVHALWLIEDETGPYLVLEYVDGRNLAELIRTEGPLPVGRALDLALPIQRDDT